MTEEQENKYFDQTLDGRDIISGESRIYSISSRNNGMFKLSWNFDDDESGCATHPVHYAIEQMRMGRWVVLPAKKEAYQLY